MAYSSRFLAYGTMSSPGSTCEGFVLSGSGFSTIDFTSLYYNPIITSTTTKAGCSPYINPRVSLPAELTSVDPLWKRCEPLYYGAFDPPRVISKTNALSPHNGQAGRVTKAQTNECPTPPPKPGPLRGPDKPDATQAPESTYLDSFDQVHCSDIPQGADKPMTNSQPGSGGQKQAAQPDHKPEASPTPLNGVSQVPAPAAPKVPSPPQNPPQPKAAPTPPMQGSPDQHIAVSKEPDNTPAQPNLPKAGPAPSNVAAQKQQQVIPESSKLQSNPPPASPQPANPPPANPPPANPPRQPSTPNTPAPNPTRESEPLSSQEKSHSEPKGFPKDSTTPDNPQPLQASSTKSKDNGHVQQPAANQAATASDLSQQPKTGPVPAHKSNQIENFVASMASELAGGSKKPAGTEKPETSIHPQSARESQVLNSPETPKTSIGASPIASPKSSDILDDSPRIITSGKSQAPIDRHLGSIEDLKLSHNTRHPTNPGDISILRDMTSDTQNDEHTPKTSQAPTITDNHTTVGDFEFLTNLQTHTSSKSTKPPDDASTTMPSKTIVEEMSRKEKESSRTQTTQPLQQTLECINKAATSSQEISHLHPNLTVRVQLDEHAEAYNEQILQILTLKLANHYASLANAFNTHTIAHLHATVCYQQIRRLF
ncbi:uncharacterized protein KY384_002244 [Bacidia gigantensis]|uniref:uncharacterized protein n=1 Tax=Bacidia gigantensis TaxID=2732470 RepID=UPI001D03D8A4|nr:uncharacterized protein KY384_002244 [Bacidia gigantensis]KAG8533461.1 hypothetical protein KY384_002244 [Bacidia gigantensis]